MISPAAQAVRYALEETGLSEKDFHKLVEISKDYDGDDYGRWVASKVIEVSEREGMPHTQLLVKWFDIIEEISDGVDVEDGEVSESVKAWAGGISKVAGLDWEEGWWSFGGLQGIREGEGFRGDLDGSWLEGEVDLGGEALDFLESWGGPELADQALNGECLSLVGSVGNGVWRGANKSILGDSAKAEGLELKTEGAGFLYRAVTIARALPEAELYLVIETDPGVFGSPINREVVELFSEYFEEVTVEYVGSTETNVKRVGGSPVVLGCWKNRTPEGGGIGFTGEANNWLRGGEEGGHRIRYTSVGFESAQEDFENLVSEPEGDVLFWMVKNGNLKTKERPTEGLLNIPVRWDNFGEAASWYGGGRALEGEWGYFGGIGGVVRTLKGYDIFEAASIPLMVFDSVGGVTWGKDELDKVGEKYREMMPYEAKDLWDFGMSILETKSGGTFGDWAEARSGLEEGKLKTLRGKQESLKKYLVGVAKEYIG